MSTSSFKIAHKLLTGAGAIEQLAAELTRLDVDNPLIVTDAALVQSGTVALALESGRVSLTSRIPISKHAAAQPPSKLGLKAGSSISVKDAILALVTRSANDIAAAIGEYLGGSESGFAAKMTAKARALGMSNTTFRNASGLPNPSQVTTARDMARLGRALQDRFRNPPRD